MTVCGAALKMAPSHMFGAAHRGGRMLARMPAWLAASVVVARAEDQARGRNSSYRLARSDRPTGKNPLIFAVRSPSGGCPPPT